MQPLSTRPARFAWRIIPDEPRVAADEPGCCKSGSEPVGGCRTESRCLARKSRSNRQTRSMINAMKAPWMRGQIGPESAQKIPRVRRQAGNGRTKMIKRVAAINAARAAKTAMSGLNIVHCISDLKAILGTLLIVSTVHEAGKSKGGNKTSVCAPPIDSHPKPRQNTHLVSSHGKIGRVNAKNDVR